MSRVLPILFNTEMARAILDGRKTVTRRKIDIDIVNQFDIEHDRKTVIAYINPETGDCYKTTEMCKYQPGDIMYVRETWSSLCIKRNAGYISERYVYKANDQYPFGEKYIVKFRWFPSIHMPKEAARIWLKVTDVRVERLQEINEKGAREEGFVNDICLRDGTGKSAAKHFAESWNSTLKKSDIDRYGWDANPWVWVIDFERCEKPERA